MNMTAEEMRIHRAALSICGCAWEDAPDCDTMAERLEWIRDNNMGRGTDGEIDEEALDTLIDDAKTADV